jgi:hypothetical protein
MTEATPTAHRIAELESVVRQLQDRNEILELAARYHQLCDGGWDGPSHPDPDALADLFTADGVYGVSNPPARGRAEIREKFAELQRRLPWIVHYLANSAVEVAGDRATAHVKGLIQIVRHQQQPVWRHVTYDGELVRTAEGWRFASLKSRGADLPPA